MIGDVSRAKHIYIVCGYTDMRKSIDGLAAIVQQNFKLDVFSGSLFLFCGKRCDRIKALLWEEDGFVLLYKKLENGKYKWPRDSDEARQITQQEFRWLMEGLSIEQKTAIHTAARNVRKRICLYSFTDLCPPLYFRIHLHQRQQYHG